MLLHAGILLQYCYLCPLLDQRLLSFPSLAPSHYIPHQRFEGLREEQGVACCQLRLRSLFRFEHVIELLEELGRPGRIEVPLQLLVLVDNVVHGLA